MAVVSEGVGDPSFFCLEISFCFGSTALRSPKSILRDKNITILLRSKQMRENSLVSGDFWDYC